MSEISCQLCIIGGGSGGIGAALAASRLGVDTVLVEKESMLGGTSTVSGVSCWEPAVGTTGIPYDIYRELSKIPQAAGIYSLGRHKCHSGHNDPPFPGGEQMVVPGRTYQDTLLRCGTKGLIEDEQKSRRQWNGVVFEPEQFDRTVRQMLRETGNCNILTDSMLTGVTMRGPGEIDHIMLADGTLIKAALWIDNSGMLATASGAELLRGEEAASCFNEPDAPEKPIRRLNGSTLIFRITPGETEGIEPLPAGVPSSCWWAERFPSMSCVQYPNGDRNCNMLPTISGNEYLELGEEQAYKECVRRVKAYWHYVQTHFPEFRRYRIKSLAKRVGVRETFRVKCEYMLNENDLLQGLRKQSHPDIIALADHLMDSHGAVGRKSGELQEPYGIPYRCLIPAGFKNLLVAGRIAGFSCIAASSCRLSRTMMQLGQAAGTAAALAVKSKDFTAVDVAELRRCLEKQHVQLNWPGGNPDSDMVKNVVRKENDRFKVKYDPASGIIISNVVYGQSGERGLHATLYQPPENMSGPYPAVVYIHGGGWSNGTREQFARQAYAMAEKGYAGLCIDHRFSKEKPYPAAIQDAKCAVRFLRANAEKFNLDANRIGAVGGSTGAHLAACLAVSGNGKMQEWDLSGGYHGIDSSIQAAVCFNGEFDLPAWYRHGKGNEFIIAFMGSKYEDAAALYLEASPIRHVDAAVCPILLLHGEKDEAVPVAQSVEFHDRIQSVGGRSELVIFPEVGHAWFNYPPHFDGCLQMMMQFLLKNL